MVNVRQRTVELKPAKCRSCKAPIVWATFSTTGKRAPFDAEPTEEGEYAISAVGGEPVAVFAPENPDARYVSHFATCPDAKKHRKAK
jgi:hypothetical protein